MNCVLICEANDRAEANLLAETFGYGPNNFSVPLSSNGSEPVTHYGGNAAGGVTSEFKLLVTAAKAGQLPEIEWPSGLSDAIVLGLFTRLVVEFDKSWDDVLTNLNIKIVGLEV